MTITIHLEPEIERLLLDRACAEGLSLADLAGDILAREARMADEPAPRHSDGNTIAHLQRTNPQEWLRQFRAWSQSHDRTTPPLSIEALNRENIYPDRV